MSNHEENDSNEIDVAKELVKALFGDCCENFKFPDLSKPLPGEIIIPTIQVNVKILAPGDQPVTFIVLSKVVENIIGIIPQGRPNADESVRMFLKDKNHAEKLIKTKKLTLNGTEYTIHAEPDKRMNQGQGTFFSRECNKCTIEELMESTQGNEIVEILPFTRNVNGISERTGVYKVTFETTQIPKELMIACLTVNIEPYFDKPMVCKNCGQLGHTTKRCDPKYKRCLNCSNPNHDTEQCKQKRVCTNCNKDHDMDMRNCQVYMFEQNCIVYASQAKIPVPAARKYGLRMISDYMTKTAKTPNIAKMLKDQNLEITKPSWYVPKPIAELKKKFEPKPRVELEIRRSYYATYVIGLGLNCNLKPAEKRKSTNISPHERAAATKDQTIVNDDLNDVVMQLNSSSDGEPAGNKKAKKSKKRH
jgi:hypothetical protein